MLLQQQVRRIELPKGRGQVRVVWAPGRATRERLRAHLPELHRRVFAECPDAHGCVPGRSAVTAARLHVGFEHTLCADLKDFFGRCRPLPNTSWARVSGVTGYPQGLPTSPALANLSAAPLDLAIRAAVGALVPTFAYTRYVDDLAISWDGPRDLWRGIYAALVLAAQEHGHEIHSSKTTVQSAAGGRVICGVVLRPGGTLAARREVRRRLRAAEHQAGRHHRLEARHQHHVAGLRAWVGAASTPECEIPEVVPLRTIRCRCSGHTHRVVVWSDSTVSAVDHAEGEVEAELVAAQLRGPGHMPHRCAELVVRERRRVER